MGSIPPEESAPSGDTVAERLAQRYRLLDVIGTGGSSSVYRAFDEIEQTLRAVKVLDVALAKNPRVRARLLQEAEVMKRVAHPNVVQICEVGQDGEKLFLAMELMLGGSLMERIAEDGPLPPRMAVEVLTGVLSALQCAHAQGVVHRDVKPHNVLLDGKGTPKVTDFGIARFNEAAMTRTGTVLGTLAFMPPEQKLSSHRVDLRSDIYSAGATLYTLLTGRFPHDLYAAELDAAHAKELYKGIPSSLVAVIRRATSFRVEERYGSASAMIEALAATTDQLPPDPEGKPLVSPLRLGRARALASVGPTLLGVTESAEPTEPIRAFEQSPPLPFTGPSESVSSLLPWLLGAVLLAFVAAMGAMWFRSHRFENPFFPSTPATIEPTPADQVPALDTGLDAPPPQRRPRAISPQHPTPSQPEPAILDGRVVFTVGAWEVTREAANRRATRVSATLAADSDITAPSGVRIRPYLTVRCSGRTWQAILHTGLPDIDPASVTLRFDGIQQPLRLSANPKISNDLLFPKSTATKILETAILQTTLDSAGGTTFTIGDGAAVRAELERCR